MCNQRMSLANRMLSLRRNEWACAGDGRSGGLFSRSLATILDRGGSDLDIALQVLAEWLVGNRHILADALLGTVFAGGLDEDRIVAAGKLLAVVVLAVPDQLVFAGQAG